MFETRYDAKHDEWYVVGVHGHLAQVRKEDGKLYAARFDSEGEAARCTNELNLEFHRRGRYEL